MLQDLPKAALVLFGHDIATKYFCEPANASSKSLVRQTSADIPCHELHALYLESNSLPSDDSFVDSDLRNAIREMYSSDYKMIASVWPEGNQYANSNGDRYSARNAKHLLGRTNNCFTWLSSSYLSAREKCSSLKTGAHQSR